MQVHVRALRRESRLEVHRDRPAPRGQAGEGHAEGQDVRQRAVGKDALGSPEAGVLQGVQEGACGDGRLAHAPLGLPGLGVDLVSPLSEGTHTLSPAAPSRKLQLQGRDQGSCSPAPSPPGISRGSPRGLLSSEGGTLS